MSAFSPFNILVWPEPETTFVWAFRLVASRLLASFPLKRHLRQLHSLHPLSKHRIFHAFHHFPGLDVLLEKLVNLLDAGSTASGDAFSAAAIDELVVAPLFGSHRVDNGFNADQFLFIDLHLLQVLERADAWELAHHLVV